MRLGPNRAWPFASGHLRQHCGFSHQVLHAECERNHLENGKTGSHTPGAIHELHYAAD